MILRVQSPDGTKRVECDSSDSTALLYDKIQSAFNLPSVFCFAIYKCRDKSKPIPSQERKHLSVYSLKHGDMLYLVYTDRLTSDGEKSTNQNQIGTKQSDSAMPAQAAAAAGPPTSGVVEDEVDVFLSKQSGLIDRPRDEKLCHHGTNAKCVHCAPLEVSVIRLPLVTVVAHHRTLCSLQPFNEGYLREHNIKHLSFHSYLRKITGGLDKGKFAALENISCQLRPGCKGHAPWPQGICTKCQPNALTLNRQVYRHVDMVMFENASLVEHFLDFWRETMHQRVGFLYGRYQPHKDVPLGIRAIVAAIYEPPQESTPDSVRLLPDDKEKLVDELASRLGLVRVGWIFTDLVAEDLQKGTVKHLRNIESCFLSAQECIMAGHFQNSHPSPCRLSPDGYFGSKFVTVCVTGDKEQRVHMEGYQVSNQCMALVRDNCLLPTKDAPELGYVRESSSAQYVPDVFYKYTDSYGNEVAQLARPLPIEYLLVDVPVSTPVEPQHTFCGGLAGRRRFPVENRLLEGHIQDLPAVGAHLAQFVAQGGGAEGALEAFSDFHLLLYLASLDIVPLKDTMAPLLEAVRTQNREMAQQWTTNEHWQTFEQILASQGPGGEQREGGASSSWTCQHCTFLNGGTSNVCDMCGLPQ
ncbi:nuclear protein localization protein 4 homolog isoform X1 [Ixodes scapularis]|uniref:nuclear protein localization protein 4 homolog isoform X1 n=1 Tax=Ixodes scapularis TaxID=6945 RepID=UPI001AD7BE56|nr:nuclear protein localization protein 4 homolog isoform X1 [Ixodes scapularis]